VLDTETKRKIDSCRDILVGKVPDPKGQVEQITIALIYKFMDDMDKQSVGMGGKPAFFVGKYAKYAWSAIFDPRVGGHELLLLYAEALLKMEQNPNIPQLFRDIFKNAFLPYRDPETLRVFLKEIDNFSYDHSERLGDAFEYLLSVLGSQGEAGQFRTPRHIIDFIVAAVDPQPRETILDPACGTAGFLISSYKHILKHHPKLSTPQKKRLIRNFVGYDISYDMVRLSLVNMYLHGFVEPHIFEYDTLTDEDRWGDSFDVILANPPFMSPKGGIRPHGRFAIQAKRSEVLFVDYIAEHLNPSGRAGVIVPEGIIFQSQRAYKKLRQMLIENYLWAVVSLPAGVFQPYSGVKTSILLMDRSLARRLDKVLFVKIEADGFDLGAQRRPTDKDDLPDALDYLTRYRATLADDKTIADNDLAHAVSKEEIAASDDYNLTGERYRKFEHHGQSVWPVVSLADICEKIKSGFAFGKANGNTGDLLHLRPMNISADGRLVLEGSKYVPASAARPDAFVRVGDVLFNNTNSKALVGKTCLVGHDIQAAFSNHITRLRANKKVIPRFLAAIVQRLFEKQYFAGLCHEWVNQVGIGNAALAQTPIPLPPLAVQEKIVAEIEGYQKIIDAARTIVETWKPTLKIDPEWPVVKLGEIAENLDGKRVPITKCDRVSGPYPYYGASGIVDYVADYIFDDDLLLISEDGANLLARVTPIAFSVSGKCWVNNHAHVLRFPDKATQVFVERYLNSIPLDNYITGSAQPKLNQRALNTIPIPFPGLETRQQLVTEIEAEQTAVEQNKKLIGLFEAKIKAVLDEVWGK